VTGAVAYDWDFGAFLQYRTGFLHGAWVTTKLGVESTLLGTLLGLPGGMILRLPIVGPPLRVINDAVRAIPNLVLIFFCYYFPYNSLLGIAPVSPCLSALIALIFAQAVYTADVVRAAVDGVPQTVILGGRALGLRERTIWWHLVLPDIIRQILPTLVAFGIGNFKLASLASVIGCDEVVYVGQAAIGTRFRSLEAWIIVAVIYIILVLPLAVLARRLEASEWLRRRA